MSQESLGFPFLNFEFVDIDSDQDFDLFLADFDGTYYLENTGTSTNPEFNDAIYEPYSFGDVVMAEYELAELDGDNDLDAFSVDFAGNFAGNVDVNEK